MATVKKKSVASYYLVAVFWLLWAFFAPLYQPVHFIIVGLLSVGIFLLGKLIWPDKKWTTPEPEKKKEPKAEEKKSTGNPEVDALLKERDRAVSEMKRLNDAILDPAISAQIDRMEGATRKIIDHVAKNPAKLPQIRRFMNYYLPTTLKLLNAYDRMDAVGVSGTNIDGTKGRIETMLETICVAFETQLDALFGDEALDISTDITVMEQMLAREGLGGMNFSDEKKDDEGGIRLGL